MGSNINSRGCNSRNHATNPSDPNGVEQQASVYIDCIAIILKYSLTFNPFRVGKSLCSVSVGFTHGYSYWTPLVSRYHNCFGQQ